jgi:hypothetical protein
MDSVRRARVRTVIRELNGLCATLADLASQEEDPRSLETMQQSLELLVSAIMSLEDSIGEDHR